VCTAPGVPANCNFYPAPTTGVDAVPQDPLAGTPADTPPAALCGPQRTLSNEFSSGDGHTIHPGTYASLDSGQRDMNLLPGVYCLTADKLASGNGSTTGIGVLIYLDGSAPAQTPKIDFSGKGSVNLQAPTDATTGCQGTADPSQPICAYLGIVIYKVTGANTCKESDAEIDFTGQATMNVMGLVYAPYSLVRYGGSNSASLTMTGQTLAGCVKFNGNGNINIIYNPNDTYSPPPAVQLVQ
jgi:hypothetical protein